MGEFTVIIITFLVFMLLVGLFYFIYAYSQNVHYSDFKMGRTASGPGNESIELKCDFNKKINISGANVLCVSGSDVTNSPFIMCDPMNTNGSLNTNTTQTITSSLQTLCNGKESCVFTLPSNYTFTPDTTSSTTAQCTSGLCHSSTLQLIATYTCQ